SASKIDKDIRAVAYDKIDFSTANPLPKWEEHDDQDAAGSAILSAATTRSVLLMANVAVESPDMLKKLKNLIQRTFRLPQQTITHTYAARESFFQTKKANIAKLQHHLLELFANQSQEI
ncbi:MAG: hypothetical protein EZS28_032500, partial [Streblomastix strix]